MKYISVGFKTKDAEQSEMLVALLADCGYEGFEENDGELKAFVKEVDFDSGTLKNISTSLNVSFYLSEIEQQNWNAKWESSFDPVIINDFAAVRAVFHAPVKNVLHEIIITPKMSFGTGHHATTYLMMEQMSHIDFKEKSVFDFGTGTGVLAILAEKMGAAEIFAIDNDDWSIENTNENIAANNCSHIIAEKADTIAFGKQYDIILANINLNVLLANMEAIAAIGKPGTIVLFSGILIADEPVLIAAAKAKGLIFSSVNERNGWLCIKTVYGSQI
jgi:ribosomal protein L11 methyltransferase